MTTTDKPVVLQTRDLRVRRGRTEVLRGVDVEIAQGEVLAILGPNGAGKSTLLQALSGLIKPAAGTVESSGRVATALQSPDLARRSARANVELALAWWGEPRRGRRAKAMDALEAMRAAHLAKRPATAISGGEQRRVHLARTVAVRPDILLLDEPFAGLDPATRGDLLSDTASALRTHAGAVVLVVHDRSEAWALADRLIVMLDGEIAAQGSPRDILERPPTAEVARFLGFTGEQRLDDRLLLTRPSQVHLDPAGELEGRVTRLIPVEDGARIDVATAYGQVSADARFPTPDVGDSVRLRVEGAVSFPHADSEQ